MVLCGSFSACRKHLTLGSLGKGPLFLLWIETMTPSRHHDAHVVHRHRPHRKLPMPWQHRQPWCCEQLIWSPATIFFPWKDYMTIQNDTHTHIYIYIHIIIYNAIPLKTTSCIILRCLESKHWLRRGHEIGIASKLPVGRNQVSARHVYSLLGEELQKLPNPHLGRSHLSCFCFLAMPLSQ